MFKKLENVALFTVLAVMAVVISFLEMFEKKEKMKHSFIQYK